MAHDLRSQENESHVEFLKHVLIMQLLASTLSALSLAHSAFAAPRPVDLHSRATTLSSWFATEVSYAWDGVFNNIGANGGKAQGASSGVVIASPSQSNPNCEFNTGCFALGHLTDATR